MKIIRYAGLEYKHSSEPTHLYHVEREGSHYLLYYRGGGSLSYDAKMTGTHAEVAAAFDKEVEFLGSGAYHNENWQVTTKTPTAHAEKILGIFEHPTFGIKWEKTGGGQSSEDQFCDMLEQQVKEWKGSAHGLAVAKHPYWPKFHAMVVDAVTKEYGNSIRLYRGIRGKQALPILDGIPSKNRGATAWTSDLSSARVYAAGKTKRGDADWVVVRRSFSPEEILLAPVMLDGPCENPDILMRLARDVEHYGDELIVDLPEFIPGDYKIVARPRGIKSESLLREYISILLVENKLSQSDLKALQAVKDGYTSERDGRKASTFSNLISMGLIDGAVDQGSSPHKTRRGWASSRYKTVSNMKITPAGESALAAGIQRAASEGDKFKKIIMQAVIDANGQPVPEHEMPGHNPKTFKLRGKYRTAFDELRGWGSSVNALSTELTSQGRVVRQGKDFERIRSELGL
jgi:hypothetical protein